MDRELILSLDTATFLPCRFRLVSRASKFETVRAAGSLGARITKITRRRLMLKKLLVLTAVMGAVLVPSLALADHLDVIYVELKEDCSFPDYLAIVTDFNTWGEAYGYRTEIAVPIQSDHVGTMVWVGRSKNAETFGRAWDAWRDAQMDSSSVPAQLQARFNQCQEPFRVRKGYDTY
jgi:hypothetical protein